MKTVIIALSLLLSSCLCSIQDDYDYNVPNELKSIVTDFINDAIKHSDYNSEISYNLSFVYVDHLTKNGVRCMAYTNRINDQVLIELDKEYFDYMLKYHPNRAKGIIYHEFGHAYLHRQHNKDFSLMNPSWTEYCDESTDPKWKILVTELFKN